MSEIIEITTRRLILRPIVLDDADAILDYRSDELTNKYQAWIPKNIDDVIDFIRNRLAREINIKGTWYQFAVILRNSNELIGDIGLHFFDQENKQVELGYTIGRKHQGNGFAKESVSGIIDYLFNKLDKHRIIASIDPENSNSIRLVQSLNFRKEAHFKESIFSNGIWQDDLIYAILKYEWFERQQKGFCTYGQEN